MACYQYVYNKSRNRGFALNDFLGFTRFGGVTVNTDSVLIKYTYFGDSNLDGSSLTTTWVTSWLVMELMFRPIPGPLVITITMGSQRTMTWAFLASYGSTPGLSGGGIQAIPEPSTLVLVHLLVWDWVH